MDQYTVTGMSCAACQARVEKAVNAVPGVTSCSVSLLTNSMGVEGSADPAQIIAAVENAGYGAAPKESGNDKPQKSLSAKIAAEEEALKDHETPVLRRRLLCSIGFLLVLMYVSMGHGMFGWPLPHFLGHNPVAIGILEMLLAGIVMVINQKFFISGFKSLFHGAPNMDALIAIGSMSAFAYSTVMLFVMSDVQMKSGSEAAMAYLHEFYYESAAMILTLITVGKMLEAYSKGKTTDALKSLMKLAPKTAVLIRDGQEVTLPVDEVRKGDIFVVRPGESIPVDGVILEGMSAVNEAALTGESIPVDKQPGDPVSSATTNQSGFLKCEATRVGEDTTLAQIIQMVSDAAATKAPVARLADTISGYFVPAVIGIAALTLVIWLLLGQSAGFALARAICVLVVSCPCALGLATPVAIMVGNGVGARNGILFKTAQALQEAGNTQIVCLDKTGTITSGAPKVTDIIPENGTSESSLLQIAASLESRSEHPLARAIMDYAGEKGAVVQEVKEFTALPGTGLTAKMGLDVYYAGSRTFIETLAPLSAEAAAHCEKLAEEGKTPLLFAIQRYARPSFPQMRMTGAVTLGEESVVKAQETEKEENTGRTELLGIIAVADTIREDSAQAIRELRAQGIRVVMLTGDNQKTAQAIGRQAGVDEVIAGVLPEGKEEAVRQLKEAGRTAMIGDGINDAPALSRADTGVAIGAGTDVAIDAADVVLMKSRLLDAAAAVRLSRATYKNILENLFWALFYNTLLIPLAAGALSHFGLVMNPMLGAAAMSLSSFCVVSNVLRLNLFKLYDSTRDKPKKNAISAAVVKTAEETPEHTKEDHAVAQDEKQSSPEKMQKENSDKNAAATQKEGDKTMTKTMKIEGMMCEHCEATVKKALEALPFVASAAVSHTEGNAVVNLCGEADEAAMKAAVEAKDYKVLGIE